MGASVVFELSHAKLASDLRFAEIGAALDSFSPIDSEVTFNRYCREACELWTGHFRKPVWETVILGTTSIVRSYFISSRPVIRPFFIKKPEISRSSGSH